MAIPRDDKEFSSVKGRIKDAYQYFLGYFKELSEKEYIVFKNKLLTGSPFFVRIEIDKTDDEQRIFDTVNSMGKGLTTADLIKNYLFSCISKSSGLSEEDTIEMHKKYWENVFYSESNRDFWDEEINVGRFKVKRIDNFLKNYATIIGIYSPSETGGLEGLYGKYKEKISSHATSQELVDFLKDLSSYASCSFNLSKQYNDVDNFEINDVLNSVLLLLDKTSTSTFDPFVLKVFHDKPDNYLDQLKALRKFVFQRVLWKAKTKNYNNVCSDVLKSSDPIAFLESYNDNPPIIWAEFPQGLLGMKDSTATVILFFAEMIRRDRIGPDKFDYLRYQYTLEHVMPRKWQANWFAVPCYKKEIDPSTGLFVSATKQSEILEVRDDSIYEIGNMTLLTGRLNTSIGNSSIATKMEGKPGKGDGVKNLTGSIQVTKEVTDTYDEHHEWDERYIYQRTQKIFDELNDYFNFTSSSPRLIG